MNETPPKRIIYGEGAVHPAFLGSMYMRDDLEIQEQADWRFNEAMVSMGFEWLGAGYGRQG